MNIGYLLPYKLICKCVLWGYAKKKQVKIGAIVIFLEYGNLNKCFIGNFTVRILGI